MANSTRLYEQVQNNSEALVMAHLGMVKRVALHLFVKSSGVGHLVYALVFTKRSTKNCKPPEASSMGSS